MTAYTGAPGQHGTVGVTCAGCGKEMRRDRIVALARHTHVGDTTHTRWVCDTPDCGGELIVEDDSQ